MDEAAVEDDRVSAALEDAAPDRGVDAVEVAGVSWNETNETVRVTFADGCEAYLKLAVDGDGEKVVRERAVVAFVRANLGVHAPEVLAAAPDREVPYLLTAPLAGRPLHEVRADRDGDGGVELACRVGRALGTLHGERFDDHGRVVGGGAGGLELDPAPWPDVLLETVELLRERSVSDRFDGYFDEVVAAVGANRDLLAGAPAALLHGDPAGPNSFLADGDVGFVDWEVAHAGDPAWELVRARDQQFDSARGETPDEQLAAFHDGYRRVAGGLPEGFEQRRPVYEAVWFLTRVGYFDNYVEFLDESETEFAEWVQAEMERRLDAL